MRRGNERENETTSGSILNCKHTGNNCRAKLSQIRLLSIALVFSVRQQFRLANEQRGEEGARYLMVVVVPAANAQIRI